MYFASRPSNAVASSGTRATAPPIWWKRIWDSGVSNRSAPSIALSMAPSSRPLSHSDFT